MGNGGGSGESLPAPLTNRRLEISRRRAAWTQHGGRAVGGGVDWCARLRGAAFWLTPPLKDEEAFVICARKRAGAIPSTSLEPRLRGFSRRLKGNVKNPSCARGTRVRHSSSTSSSSWNNKAADPFQLLAARVVCALTGGARDLALVAMSSVEIP
ncbi:unnamed protein product [Lampetra fluviatilis]